jgi:hypothetical protein
MYFVASVFPAPDSPLYNTTSKHLRPQQPKSEKRERERNIIEESGCEITPDNDSLRLMLVEERKKRILSELKNVWCNIARVVFHIIFDHSIIVKIQRFVGIN